MCHKKVVILLAITIFTVILTGCGECNHTWTPATCDTPKTCSKCGIVEGEPLGHDWELLSDKLIVCKHCGKTEKTSSEATDDVDDMQNEDDSKLPSGKVVPDKNNNDITNKDTTTNNSSVPTAPPVDNSSKEHDAYKANRISELNSEKQAIYLEIEKYNNNMGAAQAALAHLPSEKQAYISNRTYYYQSVEPHTGSTYWREHAEYDWNNYFASQTSKYNSIISQNSTNIANANTRIAAIDAEIASLS